MHNKPHTEEAKRKIRLARLGKPFKWGNLPREEIAERLLTTTATTRSIANQYGCSPNTIKLILKEYSTKEQRLEAKHRKHNLSMKGRSNPQLKEWNERHKGTVWRGRKHTNETRKTMSESRRGSDNPHWKGGLSELVKGIRNSPEYYQWRKAVLERDSHTCQDCGGSKELDVHHIQSLLDYPEGIFEIDNGLTLCKDCHKRHTSWRGIRPRRKGNRNAKVRH